MHNMILILKANQMFLKRFYDKTVYTFFILNNVLILDPGSKSFCAKYLQFPLMIQIDK